MNDRIVAKRLLNIFLMLLITFFFTIAIAGIHDKFADELIIYLIVEAAFFALFVFMLESKRMNKVLSGNRESTFRRVLIGYTMAWVVTLLSSFVPEFLKPMLVIPIIMSAVGTQWSGLCTGIFLDAILCLMMGSSVQELIFYCFLTLCGCLLAEALLEERLIIWCKIIIFSISTMFPGMFYYLTYREVKISLFAFGALEGLFINVMIRLLYQKAVSAKETEIEDILEDILDESYPMRRELQIFSRADYMHALRVSRVATRCAKLVGADEKLCAAAGFYYRIGAIEGGSIAENGIRIAQKECFPEALISIISEYNGDLALPSNIESAIVHMVDALIKKLEVFDSDTMSSNWNQDMVIYQTLNDFSAQGIYDKSGLSMNMFLKIREYLVNEEALL